MREEPRRERTWRSLQLRCLAGWKARHPIHPSRQTAVRKCRKRRKAMKTFGSLGVPVERLSLRIRFARLERASPIIVDRDVRLSQLFTTCYVSTVFIVHFVVALFYYIVSRHFAVSLSRFSARKFEGSTGKLSAITHSTFGRCTLAVN